MRAHPHGEEIMRLAFETVPISCSVAAGLPWFHEFGLLAAILANSAYSLADSSLFACKDCPRYARNAFSYIG